MPAKLYGPDEQPAIELGNGAEREYFYVTSNKLVTKEMAEEQSWTVAKAEALLSKPMCIVEFTSNPDGTGHYIAQAMKVEDATAFPIGIVVTIHMQTGSNGFTDYVAITHGVYEEPAAALAP